MRLLALDTSGWWGGAALLDRHDGGVRLIAEIGFHVADSHAARALGAVTALLDVAGWTKESLEGFVAVRGPGAFTGIRVGLGLIRGFALASGRPCAGIGTLDAMAEAWGPAHAERVPLIDAGRGEAYGARFDATGCPPVAIDPVWVADPVRALSGGRRVVVFGTGALAHEARLREAGYDGPIGRPVTGIAAAAGRIALARWPEDGRPDSELAPLYVRPSDAEVKHR
jgi:tRNA threonylcarbamoyladenosine biosynthesis protein TsaB